MIKLFGVFVVGMFVGAVCVEVLSRTKPELVDAIGRKAEGAVSTFGFGMAGETGQRTAGVSC